MATLASGANSSTSVSSDDYLNIVTSHGVTGRWYFTPTNAGATVKAGIAGSFGPKAENINFGPWGIPGTITIFNDSTSVSTVSWTIQVNLGQAGNFNAYGVANFYGSVSISPANANVTISPTGTGTVTINPATIGNINNVQIGSTTRVSGGFSLIALNNGDSSATPGNATLNVPKGISAFAAAGTAVTITNSNCTGNCGVFVQLRTVDATLKYVTVVPGAGSFTVTGNAAATGVVAFDWLLISN